MTAEFYALVVPPVLACIVWVASVNMFKATVRV